MAVLNKQQLNILAACVIASTLLSVAGSLCAIVLTIRKLRHSKNNERNTFDRLVLSLGIFDIVNSIAVTLIQLTYPADDSYNVKACVAGGLLCIFGSVGVALTNGALSLYFVLAICRRWQDQDFKWLERWWYLGIVLVPSLLLSIGLGARSVAPLHYAPACWFGGEWPEGCLADDTVECEYGGDVSEVMSLGTTGMFALVSLFGVFNIVVVWRSYRTTLRQSQRHLFRGDEMVSADKRLRRIAIQSLVYSAIYINMVVWLAIATVMGKSKYEKRPRLLLSILCVGMSIYMAQGFFNAIVYCWPAIQVWREERRKKRAASQRSITTCTATAGGVSISQPVDDNLQVKEASESSIQLDHVSILFEGSSSIHVKR